MATVKQTAREESIRKRRKMVVKMVKPFLRSTLSVDSSREAMATNNMRSAMT